MHIRRASAHHEEPPRGGVSNGDMRDARKRRHDDDGGAVAGRAGADLQRRPLGEPQQPLAALAAGLADWVMPSRDAYIEQAAALANAPDTPRRLAELRADMRRRLSASPACDGAALSREMERLYREVAGRPVASA